jgi:hypothetical protein
MIHRAARLGVFLALAGMTWFSHGKVQELRRADLPANAALRKVLSTGEIAGATVLGGFRAIAINVVWIRLLDRVDEERYEGLPALFAAVDALQGSSPSLYVVTSNIMVFDIPRHLSHRQDERWNWIRRGLKALEGALERFPGNLALLRQREFLYFQRFRPDLFPEDRKRFLDDFGRDPLRIARESGEEAVRLRGHPFDIDWNLWIIYRHEYALLTPTAQGGGAASAEALECLGRAERLLTHARDAHRGDPEIDQFLGLWKEQLEAERKTLER